MKNYVVRTELSAKLTDMHLHFFHSLVIIECYRRKVALQFLFSQFFRLNALLRRYINLKLQSHFSVINISLQTPVLQITPHLCYEYNFLPL